MPSVRVNQPHDVRIDRKTKWGNPFVIGRDGSRDQVIAKYRELLWERIQAHKVDLAELADLDGKRLGCHCAPEPCHGDVLLAAARWASDTLTEHQVLEESYKTQRLVPEAYTDLDEDQREALWNETVERLNTLDAFIYPNTSESVS